MKDNKIIALIPARSGSSRVKGKNIKLLNGKPLISYTIKVALNSKYISRVIVSTDSEEITGISRKCGAEVLFLRPKRLSLDTSTEYEFHKHAIDWLRNNEKYEPKLIVNLYPTSPFRKTETIDKAIGLMIADKGAHSLRSLKKCSEHPYKMWVRDQEYITPFVKTKKMNEHSLAYHLLPEIFIQNASVYITRLSTLNKYFNTLGEKIIGFEMSELESVDINTEKDFYLAEQLIKNKGSF